MFKQPSNRDVVKEKAFSAAIWKVAERFGAAAVSLVVQIVLARLLLPADFGLVAIVSVFVNLASVFAQGGMSVALVREPEIFPKDCATVFWFSFSVSLLLYAFLFFLAPYVAWFYSMPDLTLVLRVLGLVLMVNAYNGVQVALMQRDLKMKQQLYATLIAAVSSGLAGVIAAVLNAGVWALVIQTLSMQFVTCLVMAFQIRWRPALSFSLPSLKRMFGFGWKLLVSSLLHTLYMSFYDLLVGKMFSAESLGLFSQGRKYPSYAESILDSAIGSVTLPAAAMLQNSLEDVRILMHRSIQMASSIVFPAMMALCVVSRPFVVLVLGPQWAPAAPFFAVFCLAYMLSPITRINLQCFNAVGRSDLYLKLELVKKIIAVSLILCVSLLHNLYLLSLTSLLYSGLAVALNMVPSKKLFRYGCIDQLRDLFWPLITSMLACCLALFPSFFLSNDALLLVTQLGVFVLAYFTVNMILKRGAFMYTKRCVVGALKKITNR